MGPPNFFFLSAIPSNLLILNGPQDCSTKRRKRRRFLDENLSHAHLSVSLVLLIHGYLACLLALSLSVFRDCVVPAHAGGACMCVRVCSGAQARVGAGVLWFNERTNFITQAPRDQQMLRNFGLFVCKFPMPVGYKQLGRKSCGKNAVTGYVYTRTAGTSYK